MDAFQKGPVEKRFFVLWILWAAMVVSLLIYVVICHVIGDQIRRPLGAEFPLALLRNIFFGIGIATIIAAHFIRRSILRKSSIDPGSAAASQRSGPDRATLHAKYTTAMIISLALCEAVGIYGLVLFFLGDTFRTLYTFMVISAAGMFYYRPKREELEMLFREY